MARTVGKLDAILLAIQARIIDQCSVTAASCYIALDPNDVTNAPGDFVYVIAPASGAFDQSLMDGGGAQQATADTGVIVKIHSAVQLDEPQREEAFLTHATLGVIEKWRLLVKALTDWAPTSGSDTLVRNPLLPAGFDIDRTSRGVGGIQQAFTFNFDLDLS